ncbi:hypothetical protein F9B85_01685 [Heliorestis acidaminivorans]|uniref:Flagellar hook-length control protein FliK n=1 Tax=Heliorestis acidaminivorans TaxID=553427 RepID=A0A6I0F619_9FIRM|nr:hypothetical protein [Heliorestis acidaminivorans]KAB2954422.1 hypothetical protein F9B85_01685 [Heliorestis acidaminivorans]
MDPSMQVLLRSTMDQIIKDQNPKTNHQRLLWSAGTQLRGEVVQSLGDDTFTLLIDGKKVILQSSHNLQVGQPVTLRVEGSQQGQVVAKLLPSQPNQNLQGIMYQERNLANSLEKMGLKNTVENRLIYRALIDYQIELTPERFRQVTQAMNSLGKIDYPTAQITAFAIKANLPLQKDVLLLLQKSFGSEHIFRELQSWIEETKNITRNLPGLLASAEQKENPWKGDLRNQQVLMTNLMKNVEQLEEQLKNLLIRGNEDKNIIRDKATAAIESQLFQRQEGKVLSKDLTAVTSSQRNLLPTLISNSVTQLEVLMQFPDAREKFSQLLQTLARGLVLEEVWAGKQVLQHTDKSSNQSGDYYYFQIPFQQSENKESVAQLRVYKDAGKRKIDKKNLRLILLLHMEQMGPFSMELQIQNETIQGRATVQNKEIASIAQSFWPQLQKDLASYGYALHNFEWHIGEPADLKPALEAPSKKETTKVDLFV